MISSHRYLLFDAHQKCFGILASRTGVEPRLVGVAAVKEKQPIVIQRNLAAWIARYRSLKTHGYAYWTFSGRVFPALISN